MSIRYRAPSGLGRGSFLSADVTIDLSKFDLLRQNINGQFMERCMERSADRIKTAAQANAPKHTLLLHDNIEARALVVGDTAVIEVGVSLEKVPYAGYQEFGTSRNPAHPYLRPALDENLPTLGRSIAATARYELGLILKK